VNFRLPVNLLPVSYDLTMKTYIGTNNAWPDEKAFTFEGYTIINFVCEKPTQKIILHSRNLEINGNQLVLESADDNGIGVGNNVEYELLREFLTLTMTRECKQGAKYSLKLNYTGPITNDLLGFYRSSYVDQNGNRI
jgi:aminopeptidase N